MKEFALLVGNGINNIHNDNTWNKLVDEVAAFCNIDFKIDDEKRKNFPLLYEEIFLHAARNNRVKEANLKKFIAERVSRIKENNLHALLRSLKTRHIVTTNYEFLIEGSKPKINKGIVNERLYSVFRHYVVDGKKVWHIHGDCKSPQSINLGFEHYSGQLQHIRNYVATGTSYESKKTSTIPLIKRLELGKIRQNSWLDLFFTVDIHIVGLTLGFVETDLWWLLTFRARVKIEKKKLINNQITYYIPARFVAESKHKLDLFKATGVKVVEINKTDESFYREVFKKIK